MKYSEFKKMLEKKDHLIRKTNLTDDQKQLAIDFFEKHPNYESEIDWNNLKNLTWGDFEAVIYKDRISKSKLSQFVKDGVHYLTLYKADGITVYQPLTYVGARYLSSKDVSPYMEGEWCIAYQKTRDHWDDYTSGNSDGLDYAFLIIATNKTKTAVQIPVDSFIYMAKSGDFVYTDIVNEIDRNIETEANERVESYIDLKKSIEGDSFNIDNIDIDKLHKAYFDSVYENYFDFFLGEKLFGSVSVWDSRDACYEGSALVHYYDNYLKEFISMESLYDLCHKAAENHYSRVIPYRDEDIKITDELKRLHNESMKTEFWRRYNNCKKQNIPFVYEMDINWEIAETLDLFNKSENEDPVYGVVYDGFKVRIDVLKGSILLSGTNLISLKNFPKVVDGDCLVRRSLIKSLEGSPEEVNGLFDVGYTPITSLEGSPNHVKSMGVISTHLTDLKSLIGAPKIIDCGLYCNGMHHILKDVLKKDPDIIRWMVNEDPHRYLNYIKKFLADNGTEVDFVRL